jgi:hypothetical protein
MEESNINLDKISTKYKIEKKNVKFKMLIKKKAKDTICPKGSMANGGINPFEHHVNYI